MSLQSRDQSPNQSMSVAYGIIVTQECTLVLVVRIVESRSVLQLSAALPSRILRLYRAPGSLPQMESGLWPGDKDRVVFIPASAVPLTVMIFMLLSYLFPAHSVQLISFHQVTIHPLAGAWPGNIRKTCSNLFLANLKFLVSHYVDFFFRLAVFGSSLCHSVAVWHWASYLTFLCLTFFILWLLGGLNELVNEKA